MGPSAYAVLDVHHPRLPDALVSCAISLMSTFDLANMSLVVSAAEKLGVPSTVPGLRPPIASAAFRGC